MKNKYVYIFIRKPIWSGDGVAEVGIRDKYIWKAKREHKKLKIECPQGFKIVSPEAFLKSARRVEKVFRFPDRPMVLYHYKVYFDSMNPVEDVSIPFDLKERLREIWIEKYA